MNGLIPKTKMFVKRNASTILTFIAASGVVVTTISAIKAAPKATRLLEEAEAEKGEELTLIEKVEVAGPTYIPTIVAGTSTIACIFGANILNKRHQAAMASAYALLDNTYKQYRAKVAELVDEEVVNDIRNAVMQEEYDESEFENDEKQDLFFDFVSMRYFNSTLKEVMEAEVELDKMLKNNKYVFLNDFYELVGAEPVDYGDEVGWSIYDEPGFVQCSDIIFDYDKTELEDGMECYILIMMNDPIGGFIY